MARLNSTFKADEHNTEQFELLPNGIYKLEVSASDIKQEGNNITLSVAYDVVEPEEYKQRKIFAYIDIQNDDAERQERGQKEFAKLCRALGVNDVEETEELHFIEFTARVKKNDAGVSKAGRAYKAKNTIGVYYYPDQGNIPAPAVDANQPRQAANDNKPAPQTRAANDNKPDAAAAGGARRPWGSK